MFMFRRMLITAVSTAIFGCALVSSCGDSGAGSGETLRWRTVVDVPVNFTMEVNYADLLLKAYCKRLSEARPDMFSVKKCEETEPESLSAWFPSIIKPEPPDSYFVDLGSGSVSTTSDVMDVLRKLTERDIEYSIAVTNRTKAPFRFYGMFFQKNDSAVAKMPVDTFFNAITSNDTVGGRINMLDSAGLFVMSGGEQRYPPSQGKQSLDSLVKRKLDTLIIHQKVFSWRWLVTHYNKNLEERDTAAARDSVDIKLRIRFSGVNSIDSLLTF